MKWAASEGGGFPFTRNFQLAGFVNYAGLEYPFLVIDPFGRLVKPMDPILKIINLNS